MQKCGYYRRREKRNRGSEYGKYEERKRRQMVVMAIGKGQRESALFFFPQKDELGGSLVR